MSIYSTLCALADLACDILPALRRLVTPPAEDADPYAERQARLHADVLADREAATEVLEPQSDCGLGEADECLCRACEWGDLHDGEDCGTLVRLWIDGYHSDPITAFVDWGDGRFTITAAHPFARTISNVPVLRIGPLTVYSTDELEWLVDRVIADRTAYGPEYTVICKPRVDVLRKSLISDDYLCWLWLDAEKRHVEGDSAAPSQRAEPRDALGSYTAPEVFAPPYPSAADEPAFTAWLASIDERLAVVQNLLTSAAPGLVTPDAAPESPAPPVPEAGAGQPGFPNWCAAEMRQVADILLTADSPFRVGYANDLRRAADEHDDDHGSERVSWPWTDDERRK